MRILRVLEALGGLLVRVLRVLEALGGSFVRILRALRPWEARTYVFYVSWRLWEADLYVFYVVLRPPGFEGPGCVRLKLGVDWAATLARQTIRSTVGSTVKIYDHKIES